MAFCSMALSITTWARRKRFRARLQQILDLWQLGLVLSNAEGVLEGFRMA